METPPFDVLVTGASRGIGRAIALAFAREGARILGSARTAEALEGVAAEVRALGREFVPCPMEVSDEDSVRAAVGKALEATGGRLDVLVNNAGIFDIINVWELRPEAFRRIVEVNLYGPLYVTLASIRAMQHSDRAHVINISSTAGQQGYPGGASYCASKYGQRGMADGMREDLAERGIRISTVYPSATDTEIFDDLPGDWDRASMNTVDEVADVVMEVWRANGQITDANVPPPAG